MTSIVSISSHSLTGLTVSSSFSQIDFPAKSQRSSSSTPKFRCRKADEFAEGHITLSAPASGRRGLLFIATLPCHLPSTQIMYCRGANAIQSGTKEYLLIQEEVRKVLLKGKAAGVLRLVFHDAGTFEMDDNTGGMNGSIVYELDRHENSGLKKSIKVLLKAKTQTDAIKPVSWADMIAVAGAEAVAVCGGPNIQVSVGRQDSLTQELVALSGAHTLGSKSFGSPTSFDNSYYKVLLEKPWMSSGGMSNMIGLPSDHALVEDDECLRWIKKYADNENMFFEDFKNAYVKLVNTGARWKSL